MREKMTWFLNLAALFELAFECCAGLRMKCCECCSGVNEVTLQLVDAAVDDEVTGAAAEVAGLKHDAPWPIEASWRGSEWTTPGARSLAPPWLTPPARRIWDRLTGDDASDPSDATGHHFSESPPPLLASAPSVAIEEDNAFRISWPIYISFTHFPFLYYHHYHDYEYSMTY